MGKEVGAGRYYHYGVEATRGDGLTPPGIAIPIASFDLMPQWEKDRPFWFTGTAKRDYEIPRRYWVEGSFSVVLFDGIYQDVINLGYQRDTIANGFDMINSWGILESSRNETRQFKGVLSNSMGIAGSMDASEILVSHDCLGISEEADSPFARGALPAGLPFLFQCATVTWFGSAETTECTAFEVNIENNLLLNDGPVDCNGIPYHTIGGNRTVNGSLNLLYDSDANRVRLRDQTEGSLAIVLTNASVTPTKVITITIPRFTLDNVPEELDPESVSQEAIPFEAITDDDDDDIVIAFSTIP